MITTEINSIMGEDSNSIKDKILLDFFFAIKIMAFIILSFIILGNSFFVKYNLASCSLLFELLLENPNAIERILETQRRG